jgi:ribosomal protein S18 acetylase RimI-like enzyme
VEFRVAGDDAERIAELHAQSWRRTYRGMMRDEFLDGPVVANRLDAWQKRLSENLVDRWVYLATDGSQLVGFICVFGNEDPIWGSYIDNLHVSADYHRRGIGAVLMGHAAAWLGARYPGSGVYLWVMMANESARRFYERLGATDAGTIIKCDPGGGHAPNCRYVWRDPAALRQHATEWMPGTTPQIDFRRSSA